MCLDWSVIYVIFDHPLSLRLSILFMSENSLVSNYEKHKHNLNNYSNGDARRQGYRMHWIWNFLYLKSEDLIIPIGLRLYQDFTVSCHLSVLQAFMHRCFYPPDSNLPQSSEKPSTV